MDNYVGKRLDGRYEIQDIIGVGGMAVVYKAYDNIDDRIVAVKILKDEYLANEEFRRRFKNESKAIAILSHPNIVKVYDVSFGDRLQYIVMEYIEGITLKEYIEQRKAIDWNEALFFLIQILRALQHAHDKGIVHRDIKPQNIMLLENGTIKVADFGIARFSRGETRTMTEKAIGSVHYISPEQAKGEMTDEKADIYSVGVVLYEMLTGTLPFEADNAVSVALMQLQVEPKPPRTINPNIPVGFEQITMKAMRKNPRDRYQTAAEMLLDLEELKRNPNVKFDYQSYFVDKEPTKYVGVIQEKVREATANMDIPADDDYGVLKVKTAKVLPAVKTELPKREPVSDAVTEVDSSKKKLDNKTIAIIAGVACAVIVFLVILLLIFAKNGTLGAKKIEVDNFVGMNYEEDIVGNSSYKNKYNFEPVYTSFSDGEEGAVYDQDPKAGGTITKGGTVKIYIVKSGEGQIIPDLSGYVYNAARDTLEAMGFKVSLQPTENADVDVGKVIRTDPAANTSAFAGSTISVYYAVDADSGKQFEMPDLAGKTQSEATELIAKNKLLLSKVEPVDDLAAKDTVIAQSPAEGTPVKENTPVVITVSSGYMSCQKTFKSLPSVGSATIKVMVGDIVSDTQQIDTNNQKSVTVKIRGLSTSSQESVKVYIGDSLYYEAVADFTKSNVKITNEKTHKVYLYVNVVGHTKDDAVTLLKDAGFTKLRIVYDEQSQEPDGVVVAQTPDSSVSGVTPSDTITLVVSKSTNTADSTKTPSNGTTHTTNNAGGTTSTGNTTLDGIVVTTDSGQFY